MKIGLNATTFNDRPSGASQRFFGLYSALAKHKPDWQIHIYHSVHFPKDNPFNSLPNIYFHEVKIGHTRLSRFINDFLFWRNEIKNQNFDIFESFTLPLIDGSNQKSIITIHDIRRYHKKNKSPEILIYKCLLKRALIKADRIITVSETIRKELLSVYAKAKISVLHNGLDLDQIIKPDEATKQELLHKLEFSSGFILAIGHLEQRKNYFSLIDAYEKLHKSGLGSGLLIIGNDSGLLKKLTEYIASKNLNKYICLLQDISHQQAAAAYDLCSIFVFPSFYEGFGIPLIEAMAYKKPIACSNLEVFKEITKGEATTFDPKSFESIANSISSVIQNGQLEQTLIQRRSELLVNFSYDSLCQKLAMEYESILES